MPAKEIKELRQAGNLTEAYDMAKAEMEAEPDNIWGKRNMSWVIYSQLDANAGDLPYFLEKTEELKQLGLPDTEEMLFDNISIVISKAVRAITRVEPVELAKLYQLFDTIKELPLKRGSKWFSVLFSAFHKGFKDTNRYLEFADWWNFDNFQPEDFQKDKMPNGREIMAIAEQAYITYAKHLLPKQSENGEFEFDKEKAALFIPKLAAIADSYPHFQYPAYFQAKLLLAMGDKENMLSALLPFAKKKQNDFWVWQLLGEALSTEDDKLFACYSKALCCYSPEEMLVGLRQKMAAIFIKKQLFTEAKTEIELLVKAREAHGFKMPNEVANWQSQDWYKNAVASKSNIDFYKQQTNAAEALLFSDIPEETVIVDFVNTDKKIVNFIASELKYGFFKYDRFFRHVKVGDILKVRFQSGVKDGPFKVYTAVKTSDENFKQQFYREIEGNVRIPDGKEFGFLGDVYIHPAVIKKQNLTNGVHLQGKAIKSYNPAKKQLDWKLI